MAKSPVRLPPTRPFTRPFPCESDVGAVYGPAADAAGRLGEIAGIESGTFAGAAAQEGAAVIADGERSDNPVKAEFFRVFLGYFHELGHDAHLLGFTAGLLNKLFNEVQVALRVADNEGTVAGAEDGGCPFRELHTGFLEQVVSGRQGLDTGGGAVAASEGIGVATVVAAAQRTGQGTEEAGRHGECTLVQVHVIAAGGKDGDGIVFHFLAQASIAGR